MSRILLLLALCSVCFLAVEAQGGGRQLCERQNRICQSNERRLGRRDDVTDAFNARCRRDNSRWRNISRCELARASCQLTAVRCSLLACRDVADALRGGPATPSPRPPSRPTSRPTPAPTPTTAE